MSLKFKNDTKTQMKQNLEVKTNTRKIFLNHPLKYKNTNFQIKQLKLLKRIEHPLKSILHANIYNLISHPHLSRRPYHCW